MTSPIALCSHTSSSMCAKRRSAELVQKHGMPESILPDLERVDLSQRKTAVNYFILYDLAKRAERNADPHLNLAEMYRLAELSWARGDLQRALKSGQS